MSIRRFGLVFCLCAICCSLPARSPAATVKISLQPVDLLGVPIASIHVGEQFRIQAIVQDLRDPPPVASSGVFAAFLNATYDPGLIHITASAHSLTEPDPAFSFPSYFSIFQHGDVSSPGLISGAGASTGTFPYHNTGPQLLWSLPATATSAGNLALTPYFDDEIGHDVLIFLDDDPIPPAEIAFVAGNLTIVPEPSSFVLAGTCIIGLMGTLAVRSKRRNFGGNPVR